jgi:hypothetical protein
MLYAFIKREKKMEKKKLMFIRKVLAGTILTNKREYGSFFVCI